MAFEAKKYEFENTTFTIDDIWKRQEERNKLFEVFDQAVTVQNDYWIEKGRREEITAFGSDSDKEAKVRDALATEVCLISLFYLKKNKKEFIIILL